MVVAGSPAHLTENINDLLEKKLVIQTNNWIQVAVSPTHYIHVQLFYISYVLGEI